MGVTRAQLITKVKTELSDMGGMISSTDSVGNPFYYGINDACAQMGIASTDSSLSSIDDNTIRILSIGLQYYVMKDIIKKFISQPKQDLDQILRDKWTRVFQWLTELKQNWKDALSTNDVPVEISRPSEQIVTWGSPNDGESATGLNSGNNAQKHTDQFYVSDLGQDLTDYLDSEDD